MSRPRLGTLWYTLKLQDLSKSRSYYSSHSCYSKVEVALLKNYIFYTNNDNVTLLFIKSNFDNSYVIF